MEKVLNALKEQYNVKIIDAGMNNQIFILNESIVLRLPRYKEKDLEAEFDKLACLNGKLPLDIPQYKRRVIEGVELVEYKMLEGQELLKKAFDDNSKYHQSYSRQLGEFLFRLHGVDADSKLFKRVDSYEYYLRMYTEIEELLFQYMNDSSREKIKQVYGEYLENQVTSKHPFVLCHGDFGPTNILFKEDKITGIIDFDSMHLGDPAGDIASLMGPFGYGEDFVRKMGSYYPGIGMLIERARFYRQTFALEDALFGIKNNDDKAFEMGMKMYR